MLDVDAIRAQMPSVVNAAYFNTGTFGPFPLAVKEAMAAHVDGVWTHGRIGDARYAEQSDIEQGAREALGRVVARCRDRGIALRVIGGGAPQLAQDRAVAVARELQSQGVQADRLYVGTDPATGDGQVGVILDY